MFLPLYFFTSQINYMLAIPHKFVTEQSVRRDDITCRVKSQVLIVIQARTNVVSGGGSGGTPHMKMLGVRGWSVKL
jgi:hypothetical protein